MMYFVVSSVILRRSELSLWDNTSLVRPVLAVRHAVTHCVDGDDARTIEANEARAKRFVGSVRTVWLAVAHVPARDAGGRGAEKACRQRRTLIVVLVLSIRTVWLAIAQLVPLSKRSVGAVVDGAEQLVLVKRTVRNAIANSYARNLQTTAAAKRLSGVTVDRDGVCGTGV